jgi:hypothetical protein
LLPPLAVVLKKGEKEEKPVVQVIGTGWKGVGRGLDANKHIRIRVMILGEQFHNFVFIREEVV